MEYGNTATQGETPVSPVTNQEIDTMRNLLNKFADTLVNASTIAQQFEGLKRDMEALRERNRELDDMVAHVRQERDSAVQSRDEARRQQDQLLRVVDDREATIADLRASLEQAQSDNVTLRRERDDLRQSVDNQTYNVDNFRDIAEKANRERDEAQLQVMERDETIQRLQRRVDAFSDWTQSLKILLSNVPVA